LIFYFRYFVATTHFLRVGRERRDTKQTNKPNNEQQQKKKKLENV